MKFLWECWAVTMVCYASVLLFFFFLFPQNMNHSASCQHSHCMISHPAERSELGLRETIIINKDVNLLLEGELISTKTPSHGIINAGRKERIVWLLWYWELLGTWQYGLLISWICFIFPIEPFHEVSRLGDYYHTELFWLHNLFLDLHFFLN